MKYLIFFLLFVNLSLFYSQNKYRDISNNRNEISKFIFNEILDKNTFNSSIVTKSIFKNEGLKIYSIKTYSPHSALTVCVFFKNNLKLFCIEEEKDIEELLSFLTKNNVPANNLNIIENKIRAIPLMKQRYESPLRKVCDFERINKNSTAKRWGFCFILMGLFLFFLILSTVSYRKVIKDTI